MEPIVQIKSTAELRQIQQEQETKALQEQERLSKLEKAENERLERQQIAEQERLEAERKQAISAFQTFIDSLTNKVNDAYTDLLLEKNVILSRERALTQKKDEYNVFLRIRDMAYPVKEYNERETVKMRNRKWAYYGLPIADIVFAYLAILPITQSKLIAGFPEEIKDIMPVLGGFAAILLGYGLTLLGRWGKSSTDKEWYGYVLLAATALIVPAMYWVHFFVYSGKTVVDVAYAAVFSVVSLIIQLWIIVSYSKHIDALAYFKDKKKNEAIKVARDRQNTELNAEIQRLTSEIERQPIDFNNQFNQEFGTAFRNLATARRTHINEYGNEPIILLNQLIIYVGNAIFFRREEIPFSMKDGQVDVMSPIIFPNVRSCEEIYTNDDLTFFDLMFREIGMGVSLTEALTMVSQRTPAIVENGELRQLTEPENTDNPNDDDGQTPPRNDGESVIEEEPQGYTIW